MVNRIDNEAVLDGARGRNVFWRDIAKALDALESGGLMDSAGQPWLKRAEALSGYAANQLRRMTKAEGFLATLEAEHPDLAKDLLHRPFSHVETIARIWKHDRARAEKQILRVDNPATYLQLLELYKQVQNSGGASSPVAAGKRAARDFRERCFSLLQQSRTDLFQPRTDSGGSERRQLHPTLVRRKSSSFPYASPDFLIEWRDHDKVWRVDAIDCYRLQGEGQIDAVRQKLLRVAAESTFFSRFWIMAPDGPGFANFSYEREKLDLWNVGLIAVEERSLAWRVLPQDGATPAPDRRPSLFEQPVRPFHTMMGRGPPAVGSFISSDRCRLALLVRCRSSVRPGDSRLNADRIECRRRTCLSLRVVRTAEPDSKMRQADRRIVRACNPARNSGTLKMKAPMLFAFFEWLLSRSTGSAVGAARARPLDVAKWTSADRYDHLLENSRPLVHAWRPISLEFAQVIEDLIDRGVLLRTSTAERERSDARETRLGLTVLVPGRPPLIWINLGRHRDLTNTEAELADTVLHESVHASAQDLGRHQTMPAHSSPAADIEELCAHVGTGLVQLALKLPGAEQNKNAARNFETKLSKSAIALAYAQGQAAAAWVLHGVDLIQVRVPTVQEIELDGL